MVAGHKSSKFYDPHQSPRKQMSRLVGTMDRQVSGGRERVSTRFGAVLIVVSCRDSAMPSPEIESGKGEIPASDARVMRRESQRG